MKLTHFLALVAVVFGAGIWLLVKACHKAAPPPKPVVVDHNPPPPKPDVPPETPHESPPSRPPDGMPARAYDAEVLAWSKKTISGDKQKDVSKGKPYKINVYRESGHPTVNRVKVDLDRDDKWDEKYTFDGSTITLEVAPYDDEQYTITYHWTGDAWALEGAPAAPAPAPTPTTQAGTQPAQPNGAKVDLAPRAYDAEVMAWKDKSIASDKEKDVSKGKPYKINVYKDAGQTNVNRAKVDANRNDKFEDKYTFEPGKITLQRAPKDDEQYSETYHWTGGGWTKQ